MAGIELKDMSAKYGIAFSADMKSYPGKLWTVTAQNSNKPGLHTSNIAGAVDREDLRQIPILTVIFTSVSIGSTARFDKERPKRLWHVTPGPLFDTSKTGEEVTVSCVNKSPIRLIIHSEKSFIGFIPLTWESHEYSEISVHQRGHFVSNRTQPILFNSLYKRKN